MGAPYVAHERASRKEVSRARTQSAERTRHVKSQNGTNCHQGDSGGDQRRGRVGCRTPRGASFPHSLCLAFETELEGVTWRNKFEIAGKAKHGVRQDRKRDTRATGWSHRRRVLLGSPGRPRAPRTARRVLLTSAALPTWLPRGDLRACGAERWTPKGQGKPESTLTPCPGDTRPHEGRAETVPEKRQHSA